MDFVIRRTGDRIDLVECRINPDSVEADAVRAALRVRFRTRAAGLVDRLNAPQPAFARTNGSPPKQPPAR